MERRFTKKHEPHVGALIQCPRSVALVAIYITKAWACQSRSRRSTSRYAFLDSSFTPGIIRTLDRRLAADRRLCRQKTRSMSSLRPGSIDETIEAIRDALDRASIDEAIALLDKLRAPDQAEVFTELEPEDQAALLPRMDPDDSADILEHLEDQQAAEVAEQLDPDK